MPAGSLIAEALKRKPYEVGSRVPVASPEVPNAYAGQKHGRKDQYRDANLDAVHFARSPRPNLNSGARRREREREAEPPAGVTFQTGASATAPRRQPLRFDRALAPAR